MHRVAVLGHTGMLGAVVVKLLVAEGFTVKTVEGRYAAKSCLDYVESVMATECDAVINCVGALPASSDVGALMWTNSLLPAHLTAVMSTRQMLIHASSDAVFRGNSGPCRVDRPVDAIDPYGLSKRLGENSLVGAGNVVLRTSIIGMEHRTPPRSLIGWLSGQGSVTGYTNHLWNGVTTLTWAEVAVSALRGHLQPGVHHLAMAAPVTKYRLLCAIKDMLRLPTTVTEGRGAETKTRWLVPTVVAPSVMDQLQRLQVWSGQEAPSAS